MSVIWDKLPNFRTKNHKFLVLTVLLTAVILQIWRLTYVTLWSDEFMGTLQIINMQWMDLLTGNYSGEYNPPLYFLVLKAWIGILGSNTENTMRMLSVLLSTGSLLALYFLGKTLESWQVGLVLTSAVAFHPDYLNYSTQLRMYPLLIFLSVLALLFYSQYSFNEHPSKWWLLSLGIVLVLAAYTHYFGVLLLLIISVFVVSFLIGRKNRKQWPVLLTISSSILFIFPLAGIFLRQYSHYVEKTSILHADYPRLGAEIIIPMLSGSVSFEFGVNDPAQILSLLAVASGVIVLVRNGRRTVAFALPTAICVSSIIVVAISTRNVNMSPRYLIHVSLLAWIIASLSWIKTNDNVSRLLRVFVIMAVGINGWIGVTSTVNEEYHSPNWKNVAKVLMQEAHKEEPIVIMGWDATPTVYYLNRAWLTSYAFEEQLRGKDVAKSYLILDSKHARRLNIIDYNDVVYEDRTWQVKVIRFVPARSEIPSEVD